jgi:elongation factor G
MAKRSVSDVRNVAVVGHGSSGKTTFVDRLLHAAGVVNRAGSVDAGTSLSDYDPEEKKRKFSIDSTLFSFEIEGKALNLFDTPGYLDFTGAAICVLPAVETAVLVIDAADGVRLNTRRMWDYATSFNLARFILITHLDADNIQYDRLLASIQEAFGTNCVPVFLPIGLGQNCTGVVDLLKTARAPQGVEGDFDTLKNSLRESIIECDDALMEKYLEGEEVSADQVDATFKKAIIGGQVVPILCCAAEKGIGLKETLAFLLSCTPSPEEGRKRVAKDPAGVEVEIKPDPEGPFCAHVFKSVTDIHVGRLVFLRILRGTLKPGDTVKVARTGASVRIAHFYKVFGAEHKEAESAQAGEIVCVTKVEDLLLNDVLSQDGKLSIEPMSFPRPMMSLAVVPKSRDDEEKISAGLQRLAESDPTFRIERDAQSAELVITGMSNLHLDVMLSRLKDRYGVSADTHEPSIPYRETITRKGEGNYRHKKQTGGRGQYGEVYLRLEPNERGAGFEFIDEIKGGVIPQQYVPAVQKGIVETMQKGILAGYPIVDVKAAVYYGSYHTVDSSEAAFKIAASKAFQIAFEACKPTLLEPIARIEVTIPPQFVGDITGNLTAHRGRIVGMDQIGTMQILKAEIPMAEIRGYSAELQSMTGGEGTFTVELAGYEPVPAYLQEQIIAQRKKKEAEEEK